MSSALGRPCAIQDEECVDTHHTYTKFYTTTHVFFSFDVDLPIDCDDEYWEHPDPEKRWKQPTGKPSLVAAFLCFLKLYQVLAFSLRTIVSHHFLIRSLVDFFVHSILLTSPRFYLVLLVLNGNNILLLN